MKYFRRPTTWGQLPYQKPVAKPIPGSMGDCLPCQRQYMSGFLDEATPKWTKVAVYGGIAVGGLLALSYAYKAFVR